MQEVTLTVDKETWEALRQEAGFDTSQTWTSERETRFWDWWVSYA
ncbi:hypothetical protein DNAM5_147 [Haloarcula californiae tailed virus 1]|uniref:Uncharacterized protein n=1 Tax=Haloarcula californiae tailed virus 1 TaxID=1273746 RepID=R4T8A2_9CAUD|nr:hypothetical protein M202_gp074 [Haloarcula californiae tailed virus 1]AGM12004.1 hypothetical protein DNAM5_147 [Haloarcula californiae tailed virus 1]